MPLIQNTTDGKVVGKATAIEPGTWRIQGLGSYSSIVAQGSWSDAFSSFWGQAAAFDGAGG